MNTEAFITCAVTGAGDTTARSAHVPVTPEEIADSALDAARAGAAGHGTGRDDEDDEDESPRRRGNPRRRSREERAAERALNRLRWIRSSTERAP